LQDIESGKGIRGKMKRKGSCLVLLLVVSRLLFAGTLAGPFSTDRVLTTSYFEITYTPACEQTARNLSKIADSLYLEMCMELQTEPYLRHIPVVITAATNTANAYYSSYPYNKIVLYDTSFPLTLSLWADTLTGIFTHELFHFVSMTMKTPFLKVVGGILGDMYTPISYSASSSILEGAAVLYESKDGGGRLNNPKYTAKLKEAKLEGRFPVSYLDCTGFRDTNPTGDLTYSYSSAFLSYVKEKHGTEAYNKFLKECNTLLLPVDFSVWFRDSFGLWPEEDWKAFAAQLPVPCIQSEGIEAVQTEANTLFASNGKQYVSYSSTSGEVFLDGRKPFTKKNITDIAINKEGTLLAVGFNDMQVITTGRVSLYDIGNRAWIPLQEKHLGKVAFVGHWMVTIQFESQYETILVYDLEGHQLQALPLSYGEQLFSLAGLDDTVLVSIIRTIGEPNKILLLDLVTKKTSIYTLPEGVYLYSLGQKDENTIAFTWAQKDSLLRLGLLDIRRGTCSLQQTDILAGVQKARWYDGTFVIEREFFDHTELATLDIDKFSFTTEKCSVSQSVYSLMREADTELQGRPYAPIADLAKGTFVPFSTPCAVLSYSGGLLHSSSESVLGVWRVMGDRFDDYRLSLGGGYLFRNKLWVLSSSLESSLACLRTKYALQGTLGLKDSLVHQFEFTFSSYTYLGEWFVKNSSRYYGLNVSSLWHTGFYEGITAGYSSIRTRERNKFSYGGVSFYGVLSFDYQKEDAYHFNNLAVYFRIRIPHLLPVGNTNVTYNLPFDYTVSLYPFRNCFLYQNAGLVLLSIEMQRGTPFIHLFFKRFNIQLYYTGYWFENKDKDWQLLYLGESLQRFGTMNTLHQLNLSCYFEACVNNRALGNSNGKLGFTLTYTFEKTKPISVTWYYDLVSI